MVIAILLLDQPFDFAGSVVASEFSHYEGVVGFRCCCIVVVAVESVGKVFFCEEV